MSRADWLMRQRTMGWRSGPRLRRKDAFYVRLKGVLPVRALGGPLYNEDEVATANNKARGSFDRCVKPRRASDGALTGSSRRRIVLDGHRRRWWCSRCSKFWEEKKCRVPGRSTRALCGGRTIRGYVKVKGTAERRTKALTPDWHMIRRWR